jgi:Na+/proline symporter
MKRNSTVWLAIYAVAFVVFFGGHLLGVQSSSYFHSLSRFVCSAGSAVLAFWLWFESGRRLVRFPLIPAL